MKFQSIRRRITAALITVVIILSYLPKNFIWPVKADNENAKTEASASSFVDINGVIVNCDQNLKDNRDGSYTLTFSFESTATERDESIDNKKSKSGYLIADHDASYLIEVFGGNGSAGGDTIYSEGGQGGKGGRVFGIVDLKEGDIIYYDIGGNGEQTFISGEGGGYGGGAGHGDDGSHVIGGGGGYSAIYLFKAGEEADYFKSTYLDKDGNFIFDDVLEADRISKYIMIAGGGGGGGSGNSWQARLPRALYSPFIGPANGGNGGTMSFDEALESPSGVLSGSGYSVSGTFYAGGNGNSSGKNLNYIGKGGSNVPGAISETWGTFFYGVQPNDWEGTINADIPGGFGGAGNLRGGAGGAGFCGGSGGSMCDVLRGADVGGGGGGSSFVASVVIPLEKDDDLKSFLSDGNKSETGGAVYITRIPEEKDFSFMNDISLQFKPSEYFVIDDISCLFNDIPQFGEETGAVTTDFFDEREEENASLPYTFNFPLYPDKDKIVLSVTLETVSPFAGGNGVPIFDIFRMQSEERGYQDISHPDDVSFVNVKLKTFGVISRNISSNVSPFKFNANDLYEKKFANLNFDDPAIQRCYNFIDNERFQNLEVKYRVYSKNLVSGELTDISGQDQEIESTTIYQVAYTVYPLQTRIALVGEALPSEVTYSGTATAFVNASTSGKLADTSVSYTKTLQYLEDSFTLKLNVIASSVTDVMTPDKIPARTFDPSQNVSQASYTVPESGNYYVRSWGGNGAPGESVERDGVFYNGGTGGKGGYVDGVIHLNKGDVLTINLGANGQLNYDHYSNNRGDGGGGGGYTSIQLKRYNQTQTSTVMIAGGGGGGSGADAYGAKSGRADGRNGNDCSGNIDTILNILQHQAFLIVPLTRLVSVYAGVDGYYGKLVEIEGGRNLRTSAFSEISASENAQYKEKIDAIKANDTYVNNYPSQVEDGPVQLGGAVKINCLSLDNTSEGSSHEQSSVQNLKIDAELIYDSESLMPYFDVSGIWLTTGNNEFTASSADGDNGSYIVAKNGNGSNEGVIQITDICAPIIDELLEDGINHEYTVNFTVNIGLTPKEGFLGGNDVPLLDSMSIGKDSNSISVNADNATDFVNVQIPEVLKANMLNGAELVYYKGGDPVNVSDLYTFTGQTLLQEDPDAKWKSKFVEFCQPSVTYKESGIDLDGVSQIIPLSKTDFKITAAIRQKAEARLAPIVHDITDNEIYAFASVDVRTLVLYELDNVTTSDTADDGVYSLALGSDFDIVLSAESGWKLPKNIEIKIGDTKLESTDYTYSSETGELHIDSDLITNKITVIAAAEANTYTLTYQWMTNPILPITGSAGVSVVAGTSGDDFSAILTDLLASYTPISYPGYKFNINYNTHTG